MRTSSSEPSAGSTRASVCRARSPDEHKASSGRMSLTAMYARILSAARSPRGASGRSRSSTPRSSQLDFAWRSNQSLTAQVCARSGPTVEMWTTVELLENVSLRHGWT